LTFKQLIRRRSRVLAASTGLAIVMGGAASACPAAEKVYRFVGKPIITQTAVPEAYGGGFTYDVYMRLNRPLPRVSAKRGYAAEVRVEGTGGDEGISTLGRRRKHCYATSTDTDLPISNPEVGTEVTLTVKPRGARTVRKRVKLSKPLPAGFDLDKPYVKALDCGK
jgi:hypothetical protein